MMEVNLLPRLVVVAAAALPLASCLTAAEPAAVAAGQLQEHGLSRLVAQITRQLYGCWTPPARLANTNVVVTIAFSLDRDGGLAGDPVVKTRGSGALFESARDSALKAVRQCTPFHLPVAQYDYWREVEVNFDPRRPASNADLTPG